MPITQLNQLQIAYKKLLGKSHVSPNRTEVSELIPSFVQSANSTVFGQTLPSGSQIPTNQTANLYQTSSGGIVELVRFELTQLGDGDYTPSNGSLSGTTIDDQAENTTDGAHGYALRISGSYNARSNNPRKNTGLFTDGGFLTGSAGSLQLVPPAYDSRYAAKAYQSNGTEILGSNAIEWSLDYASGVLFVQDYDSSVIPAFVDAFLYIGKYTNEVVADLSASLQNVAGTNAYATMSVGGVAVIADTATGNLNIASGSFAGSTNTNNNLLISGSAGNDTITFSFNDSPRFTHITASGNISGSGNLSITGTSTLTGRLTANGDITTTNITASGTPTAATATDVLIIGSSGQVSKISTSSLASLLTGQSVLSFATMSVGGTNLIADNSIDSLTINSGSFGGSATTRNNLLISASQDDTITFSFLDSPTFTDINVNGGNISTTTNGTATIFTANATNISIGGAATTTMTIGGASTTTTVQNNLTVGGNLTVNGTTTILNVEDVMVEDRFILLASGSISGSATHADGGIIVQYTTGSGGSATGSALFLNSNVSVTSPNNQTFSARWGLNNSVGHEQTTLNPTDYLVSVTRSQAVPTAAPEFGGQLLGFGNMYIQNNGDIWFWSPDLADNEGNIVYAG